MSKHSLSFLDYLSEAFNAKPRVKGMGDVPLNKLAVVGVFFLGFVNIGFWFIGAALEMFYLWMLSTDSRFQRYVQSKHITIAEAGKLEKLNAMRNTLDSASAKRLERLDTSLAEINELMEMHPDGAMQFVRESKQQTLGQLPVLFLKLLVTRRLICDSLERTDVEKLKAEVKSLTVQLEAPQIGEALANSVKRTIEIQTKRLENIRRAQENLRLVEMELNRIENQVQLIREETALDRSPEALSQNIDRINMTLGETEQWMVSHSEFFSKISGDDLDIPSISPQSRINVKE